MRVRYVLNWRIQLVNGWNQLEPTETTLEFTNLKQKHSVHLIRKLILIPTINPTTTVQQQKANDTALRWM